MKTLLFLLTIFVELFFLIFLGIKIIQKQKNILGAVSINPIKKESVVFESSNNLKYFYEPKSNSIDKVNEWSPYQGVYTINSDSLNERFDYSVEKSKKTYRIITLGDSFTYGLYVDTKDNWPERLEDLLNNQFNCPNFNKFEVINLAVHGYDLQYNVERFKRRGQKYNPDLVIWFIVDFDRINEKMRPLLLKYTNQLKSLNNQDNNIYYKAWTLARNDILQEIGEEGIYNQNKTSLTEINNYYKGPLYLITAPWLTSLQKQLFKNFTINRKFIFYFDGITDIHKNPESSFPNDGHPSQKGHQIIANDVFQYLLENKIIPCN